MQLEVTIPESWDDVTIAQWQAVDLGSPLSIVTEICGIPKEQAVRIDDISLLRLFNELLFIREVPTPTFVEELNGYQILKDLSVLTGGELEELEFLCADFRKNAHFIAAWLYRKQGVSRAVAADELAKSMSVRQMIGFVVHSLLVAGILIEPQLKNIKVDNNG